MNCVLFVLTLQSVRCDFELWHTCVEDCKVEDHYLEASWLSLPVSKIKFADHSISFPDALFLLLIPTDVALPAQSSTEDRHTVSKGSSLFWDHLGLNRRHFTLSKLIQPYISPHKWVLTINTIWGCTDNFW